MVARVKVMIKVNRMKIKELLLCGLSAVLLTLSFPRADFFVLAWVGLIPLFFALDGKRPLAAYKLSYFCGLLFFAGTLYWIGHVTVFGTILLIAYLAIYFGLFGIGYAMCSSRRRIVKLICLASLWVILEFIRAHLWTGFGWASLGLSQYKNLLCIQVAEFTGLGGVSFLIVFGNLFLKEISKDFYSLFKKEKVSKDFWPSIIVAGVLLVFVIQFGVYRLFSKIPQGDQKRTVAVIQGNIAQENKWNKTHWPIIMEKHLVLTQEASKEDPDLIIWPETSFPGFWDSSEERSLQLKSFIQKIQTPLLFGVITHEEQAYYNSAVLLSSKGELLKKYNKLHLVPFGEYVPFRRKFPLLASLIPIADFDPGQEVIVFPLPKESSIQGGQAPFSVLICFEDTVPHLSRGFVNNGAQLLVNITNDAWFKDTKAPFMHLQSSVFRAVENKRSLIRAANTGVSSFIDPVGRVFRNVKNAKDKRTFVPGYAIDTVAFSSYRTFYTKHGDVFVVLCLGLFVWGIIPWDLIVSFIFKRKKVNL